MTLPVETLRSHVAVISTRRYFERRIESQSRAPRNLACSICKPFDPCYSLTPIVPSLAVHDVSEAKVVLRKPLRPEASIRLYNRVGELLDTVIPHNLTATSIVIDSQLHTSIAN